MNKLNNYLAIFSLAAAVGTTGVWTQNIWADTKENGSEDKVSYIQSFDKSIKVTHKNVTVGVGDSCRLKLQNVKSKNVKWNVKNNKAVKAKKDGTVKGLKTGVATVYATVKGSDKKYTVKVKVVNRKINKSKLQLALSEKKSYKLKIGNLKADKVKWSSNNPDIAKVRKDGKVVAVKNGTTTITGVVKGGKKKYKCRVTVTGKKDAFRCGTPDVKPLKPQEQDKKPVISTTQNIMSQKMIVDMCKDKGESIVYSPLSLDYIFGMDLNGAADDDILSPKKAIETYFGQNIDIINDNMLSMLKKSEGDDGLTIANSIWYKEGMSPFKDKFADKMATYYKAPIYIENFEPDNISKKINQWAKDNTNNLIDNIVEPEDFTPESCSVFVNTVFFDKKW
ncbi:MAG: Ig-like domain-containing protein, partial [Lachnospiraceae bacterium]|nr:Ig-like domain-containing protein [Lachnospiraceae bacterium]